MVWVEVWVRALTGQLERSRSKMILLMSILCNALLRTVFIEIIPLASLNTGGY
jgi:hypothetical protein